MILHLFFPDSLKVTKVAPLYKGGVKTELTNYRTISILPSFSKILKKLLHTRILQFLSKHSILILTQNGFRSKHATTHALINTVSNALDDINRNYFTAFSLLDLKKAFDTVDHVILLRKLNHYRIQEVLNDIFVSYSKNRKQNAPINNNDSHMVDIQYDVPQGSVLGPLLFLLYINDLINYSSNKPRLFADDSCLTVKNKSIENVKLKIKIKI